MSYTKPHTYSSGELVTASMLNTIPNALLWDSTDAGVSLPAATVTTSSLDQTFKHLHILASLRDTGTTGTPTCYLRPNSDSGSNYDAWGISANATTVAVAGGSGGTGITWVYAGSNADANKYATCEAVILNYASTGMDKTALTKSGGYFAASIVSLFQQTATWKSTSAITTLAFVSLGTSFAANSRFTIYGLG